MENSLIRLALAAITLALFAGSAFARESNYTDPIVDLGYARYRGYHDDDLDLDIWMGIRYAAPPVGKLRWQAPQPPPCNASSINVTSAIDPPPVCPQTGAFGTPAAYGFNSGPGDEDCLYLNVYAPHNAKNLPVLIWIHGGGNSVFGASLYDPSALISTNNNSFVAVMIQYRLGAFGYLASREIKARGALNAGLLDQRFSMQWVRQYISEFGGDMNNVTIGGESSGAGSVMYHAMSYDGNETGLFNNIIAASPWAPPAYRYDDNIPMGNYEAFSELAGCGAAADSDLKSRDHSVFDCLVAADTMTLQNASGLVSTTRGYFGTFAFGPVVDDEYIRDLPSKQLLAGRVAGKRILVGNNANEGVPLTNPEVSTKNAYDAFISSTFPNFTAEDKGTLDSIYQITQSEPGNNRTRFDTLGDQGPTALTVSEMATGLQQTVFNIAAESLFDCPAQWLAEAFSADPRTKNNNTSSNCSRRAWKYQYSVTPAFHGADLPSYFPIAPVDAANPRQADFDRAIQKIWGSFIVTGSPVISLADATAGVGNATAPADGDNIDWPAYTLSEPYQMDLNTTGGHITLVTVTPDLSYYERSGSVIVNTFRLVNATSWEGGVVEDANFGGMWLPECPTRHLRSYPEYSGCALDS
ncbi:carboxylesterase [Apiospora rasikravindrae]|uniref:Carboxylic ester hydrolase n=1 Tax=Apiospora rasikravindrae TaxID=990691 RepID=A0ABR1SPQ9_9PEZI